jgi:hypothetical protein
VKSGKHPEQVSVRGPGRCLLEVCLQRRKKYVGFDVVTAMNMGCIYK